MDLDPSRVRSRVMALLAREGITLDFACLAVKHVITALNRWFDSRKVSMDSKARSVMSFLAALSDAMCAGEYHDYGEIEVSIRGAIKRAVRGDVDEASKVIGMARDFAMNRVFGFLAVHNVAVPLAELATVLEAAGEVDLASEARAVASAIATRAIEAVGAMEAAIDAAEAAQSPGEALERALSIVEKLIDGDRGSRK